MNSFPKWAAGYLWDRAEDVGMKVAYRLPSVVVLKLSKYMYLVSRDRVVVLEGGREAKRELSRILSRVPKAERVQAVLR